MSVKKIYLSANELLSDSFLLAEQIHLSDFKPDFVIGIWRGGAPVGVYVQEYLQYVGIANEHFSIRTQSYTGINQQEEVKVQGLDYLIGQIQPGDNILLVDDVFDTGRTIEAIFTQLAAMCEASQRADIQTFNIKVACPWYKPDRNLTSRTPDFYLHETADWLVFPHELIGLTMEEIQTGKGTQGKWLAQKAPQA